MMRELFTPTLLGLLLYTFVLLMNHFFLVAEKALTKNLSADLTVKLFMVGIPKLLVMSIPMAILLGTLIALGRFSADNEWVALQAAGRGPSLILRPVLLHGFLGALLTFLIYAVLVPQTHYAIRNLRGQILFSSNLAADLKPRVFRKLQDDAVLFVDEIRPGGERRLEGVLLLLPDPDNKSFSRLVLAKYGDIYPDPDRSGALLIDLYDGEWLHYGNEPEQHRWARFGGVERYRLEAPGFIKALLAKPNKMAQDLPFPELLTELREAEEKRALLVGDGRKKINKARRLVADRRVAAVKVELHKRVALPMAAFFFAFLALPLGITGVRSGKGAGFAMSVVVILVYRVVFVLSTNQSLTGRLPAALGPWIANILILLWALVAMWRMRRRSTGSGTSRIALLVGRLQTNLEARRRRRVPSRKTPSDEPTGQATGLVGLGGSPRRFIGRLDRYLGLAYLRMFAFSLISVYMLFALVELQDLVDRALRTHQPMSLVADYFWYFAPGVLPMVLPISCLVGAIVSVTLLSRSNELVAIKAAGVSLRRATLPIILLTLALGGILFLVQDRIAPGANRKAQEIKDEIYNRNPRTHGLPTSGSWAFGPAGRQLYHFRIYDPSRDEYDQLRVFTLDRQTPRVVDYRFSERATRTRDGWELGRGWYGFFTPRNGEVADVTLTRYDEPYQIDLDLPSDPVRERLRLKTAGDDLPDQLSLAELQEQIDTLQNRGYDITQFRVAYHGKLAGPLSPLVMVLLGLPFAFRVGRRGSLYGIGVALLLVLVYWATYAVFNALGLETILRPYIAAWAPNALFGLLGIYLLLYVKT
jgi:LPS export ABC transporter permease LptG/LPS export ABC transporter permease LptF